MEEFIENFNDFRDYLYNLKNQEEDNTILKEIIAKFEELGLVSVF